MLRITSIYDSNGPVLKLEGKLLAPWTEEVLAACGEFGVRTEHRRLDLRDVSYVDASGVKLLKTLQDEGFDLTACSLYVTAILHTEAPQ